MSTFAALDRPDASSLSTFPSSPPPPRSGSPARAERAPVSACTVLKLASGAGALWNRIGR